MVYDFDVVILGTDPQFYWLMFPRMKRVTPNIRLDSMGVRSISRGIGGDRFASEVFCGMVDALVVNSETFVMLFF